VDIASHLFAERSPDELSQLRVLDPSCGCGAFLIGCFRFLIHWHERQIGDTGLAKQLSIQFMENAFRGCDIDSRALWWTSRLLLLASWESMRSSNIAFKSSIPNFKSVLNCRSFLEADGNSILQAPEYDAIIGGPPFVRLEALYRGQRDQLRYYRRRFLSAQRGQFDLYMLFIEHALDMLKPGGLLAFSLSNSFLRSEGGRRIRGYIAANAVVEEVLEFDDPRTYSDAATQIALLRLRKTKGFFGGRYVFIRGQGRLRQKLDHLASDHPHSDITILSLNGGETASSCWSMIDRKDQRWLESIQKIGVPLGRMMTVECGLSTGIDKILLLKKVGKTSTGIILAQCRGKQRRVRFEAAAMRTVIRGHQLSKYDQNNLPNVCPFPFDNHGTPLSEAVYKETFPLTYHYSLLHRETLSRRTLAKGCPWYSTFLRLPGKIAGGGRLMSAKITSGNGFKLINDPKLVAHCSVVVLTPHDNMVDLHYLLGILNSNVFARYVSLTMPRINAGRFSLRLSSLRRFPVPTVAAGADETTCSRIASLVSEWLQGPTECFGRSDLPDIVEADVARLYGVVS
jgi:hypothetical protein